MRLIWGCACIAALVVLSAGDAFAQSQRGVITVSVRVVRSATPQTQTQTQTQAQLTEPDGTSTEVSPTMSVTADAEGAETIPNLPLLAGDVASPTNGSSPSSIPLSRFRVLTINY